MGYSTSSSGRVPSEVTTRLIESVDGAREWTAEEVREDRRPIPTPSPARYPDVLWLKGGRDVDAFDEVCDDGCDAMMP